MGVLAVENHLVINACRALEVAAEMKGEAQCKGDRAVAWVEVERALEKLNGA